MLELLMPAGNIEKLKYSIKYGADAVYLGVVDYSLRTMRSGEVITHANIKEAIEIAHNAGKKAYCTLNIFAHNLDIRNLEENIEIIAEAKPDALIFGDFGVFHLIKKYMPDVRLHVSTQSNTLNYEAVRFWQDMGVHRVILARELNLSEIAEIHEKVPEMELEMLVQGAQCVSYSGRCLLSDAMTDGERKSNKGFCAQPCRWKYYLVEESRLNLPYEIGENEQGTYILSPKDLALIKYLPQIEEAGVCSIKIEGRTKSMYYAANVAKTYRKALDAMQNGQSYDAEVLLTELKKVGNRGYTTGFALGEISEDEYRYHATGMNQGARFFGIINDKNDDGMYFCKMKYKLEKNQPLEIFTPEHEGSTRLLCIQDIYGNELEVANTNQEVYLKFEHIDWLENDYEMAIMRSI